ncbi:MAG: 50S ribosomal protein L23 [Halobacteriovoraceae bacterium]|nr:50S ribosomal protein L23 [Halobacteriovoraceae bacterium]
MHLEDTLLKPITSEKAQKNTEKYNRYGFKVALRANKNQIKNAVEKLYKVKVLNVKTNITPGKTKRRGQSVVKNGKVKTAYVQLAKEQSINFHEDR